jgi:hypothetical protein
VSEPSRAAGAVSTEPRSVTWTSCACIACGRRTPTRRSPSSSGSLRAGRCSTPVAERVSSRGGSRRTSLGSTQSTCRFVPLGERYLVERPMDADAGGDSRGPLFDERLRPFAHRGPRDLCSRAARGCHHVFVQGRRPLRARRGRDDRRGAAGRTEHLNAGATVGRRCPTRSRTPKTARGRRSPAPRGRSRTAASADVLTSSRPCRPCRACRLRRAASRVPRRRSPRS